MVELLIQSEATGDMLLAVAEERERQEELKRQRKFQYSCADNHPDMTPYRKATILGEEMGEVCRAVNQIDNCHYRNDHEGAILARQELKRELIQVAAVAVAWAESLS